MVKLSDNFGKPDAELRKGAYYRCFGDLDIARLFSRVQSLIIKNGYELENIVHEGTEDIQIEDLDEFLDIQIHGQGVYVAIKKTIKKSIAIESHGIEPDYLIFERRGTVQNCYIIELKDGHEFDTKSSAIEHQNLHTFLSKNANALRNFQAYCKICGFNAKTKAEIIQGFKGKIAPDQAMLGSEFCRLIGLSYSEIRRQRASDREHNLKYVIDYMDEIINSDG